MLNKYIFSYYIFCYYFHREPCFGVDHALHTKHGLYWNSKGKNKFCAEVINCVSIVIRDETHMRAEGFDMKNGWGVNALINPNLTRIRHLFLLWFGIKHVLPRNWFAIYVMVVAISAENIDNIWSHVSHCGIFNLNYHAMAVPKNLSKIYAYGDP